MLPLLAIISGDALINVVIWIVVIGCVFALLNWLVGYVGLPEPFAKVARVILAVVGVILLIRMLVSLTGVTF